MPTPMKLNPNPIFVCPAVNPTNGFRFEEDAGRIEPTFRSVAHYHDNTEGAGYLPDEYDRKYTIPFRVIHKWPGVRGKRVEGAVLTPAIFDSKTEDYFAGNFDGVKTCGIWEEEYDDGFKMGTDWIQRLFATGHAPASFEDWQTEVPTSFSIQARRTFLETDGDVNKALYRLRRNVGMLMGRGQSWYYVYQYKYQKDLRWVPENWAVRELGRPKADAVGLLDLLTKAPRSWGRWFEKGTLKEVKRA